MRLPAESFQIRRATPADIPALSELIDLSVRTLQAQDHSPAQIEGALGTVFGVDRRLIADGTYFVVETADCPGGTTVIGCGGWSKRKTLFGAHHLSPDEEVFLDPQCDSAKIRAFFVHPDWARQGIGSRLLERCETDAKEAGFAAFELGATLTGEHLYRKRGYRTIGRIEVPLSNGEAIPVIRMSKLQP